eukprot:11858243-Alexandrium_andersonii.AAC.1
MSASLVGSEMCIRDRGTSAASRRRAPAAVRGVEYDSGFHDYSVDSELPVSYTHLTLPTICSV